MGRNPDSEYFIGRRFVKGEPINVFSRTLPERPPDDMICIFDFDGTLTALEDQDVEDQYRRKFVPLLADYLEMPVNTIKGLMRDKREELLEEDARYGVGWMVNDAYATLAVADIYIETSLVAKRVIEDLQQQRELGHLDTKRIPYNEEQAQQLLLQISNKCIRDTVVPFRDGADELIAHFLFQQARHKNIHFAVITNSDPVRAKSMILEELYSVPARKRRAAYREENILVIGNAKKYLKSPGFTQTDEGLWLPDQQRYPGYPRPISLRQEHYYRSIKEVLVKKFNIPRNIPIDMRLIKCVTGDIEPLDLSLIRYMRDNTEHADRHLNTVLISGKRTPNWDWYDYTPVHPKTDWGHWQMVREIEHHTSRFRVEDMQDALSLFMNLVTWRP